MISNDCVNDLLLICASGCCVFYALPSLKEKAHLYPFAKFEDFIDENNTGT